MTEFNTLRGNLEHNFAFIGHQELRIGTDQDRINLMILLLLSIRPVLLYSTILKSLRFIT